MDVNSAIRKIQKCLALSKSSNAGEAAAAMRQAQKMMAEFNVSPEMVGMMVVEMHQAKSLACTKPAEWEVWLSAIIAKAFGCASTFSRGWFDTARNRDGAKGVYTFIGPKAQAMTAAWTMDLLRNQIANGRAAHIASKTWERYELKEKMASGNAWAESFVHGVSSKVEKFANPNDTQAAIDKKVDELTGGNAMNDKKVTKRSEGRPEDYRAGREAGAKASIHRPIG